MSNTAKIYHALANSNRIGRVTIGTINFPVDITDVKIDSRNGDPEVSFRCDVLTEVPRADEATIFRQAIEAMAGYGGSSISGSLRNGYTYTRKGYSDVNIKKVIFNDPATIVFWEDETKTVVKASNEPFDPEKGLAMAIVKKAFGNKGNYFNTIKKWLPEEPVKKEEPKPRWQIRSVYFDPKGNVTGEEIHPVTYSIKSSATRRAKQLWGDNPQVNWKVEPVFEN